MTNNTNNSNIHSVQSKELVREYVAKSSLNINADEVVSVYANELNEIDFDKFKVWFDENKDKIANAYNRQRYFNTAFKDQMKKETFMAKGLVAECNTLVKVMRERGIVVTKDDCLYISIMWNYIFAQGMTENQACNLNHKVLEYMEDGQTFNDYLGLIKRSNAIKPFNIDWDKVQSDYEKELATWTVMLNDLSLEALPND